MNRLPIVIILATLLVILTIGVVVAAAPPLPSSFYGTATIAGQNVPAGTTVAAFSGSTRLAQTTTFNANGLSVYRLDAPGDDPDTPAVEGGRAGDLIRFQVMGFDAEQTATWTTGAYTRLDLTATPGPVPPIAQEQSVTTDEDTPVAITLTATDFNNDPLTYTVVTTPTFGVVSGAPPNVTYTPNADYFGADAFTFRANDGAFDSNTAIISITVQPVNDAPHLVPLDDQTIDEGDTRMVFVAASDVEGDSITLSAARLPAFATFVDNGGGQGALSLAPGFDAAGVYPRVTLQAADGRLSSTQEFTITVSDAPPLPRVSFFPAKGMNVAQLEDGASITSFSSAQSTSTSVRPENAIDNNTSSNWVTANGRTTNQWIKVNLTGDGLHVVDRVVLKGTSSNNGLRDFEIRVSTTGSADADFTTILTGTVPQDTAVHEFSFAPTRAAYVQLFARNNWGNTSNIAVGHFQIWTRDRAGGIVSLQEGPPATIASFSSQNSTSFAPEDAIDENANTAWRSANGQPTNQWLKVQLGGGLIYMIDRVRLLSNNATQAAREFTIRVSTTISDDAAFTTVFTGTAASTTALQEFAFASPVPARYVQLFVHNNHGSVCCVHVNTFEVLTPDGANVARLEGVGAFALAASSQANAATGAEQAIDFRASTVWQTANGQTANQWFKVRLIEGAPYLIDRVRLEAPAGVNSPRDFELRIANAGLADADFVTVITGTLPNDGLPHWFSFPAVSARYIQLFIRNNYGGAAIQVKGFQVYSPELGGAAAPFDDFSSDPLGAPLAAWSWDFGDGATATAQHPVHTFAAPGVYPVRLTVTNNNGLTNTTVMTYTVLQPPTADFTWSPATPNEGQITSFTDRSTDADGQIVSWRWRFAHTTAEQITQNSSTSFLDNGEYPVILTATDSQFLTASVTKTVTVLNAPPTANAGANQTVVWGQNWELNPSVSDPGSVDRTSLMCDWDFGDGQATRVLNCTNTTVDVIHAYANPGVYTATLTVTDKDGASVSDSLTTTVNKRDTFAHIFAALSANAAGEVEVAAKLVDRFDLGTSIAGRLVSFSLGTQTVSATTNADGIATAELTFIAGITNTVSASFAGDGFYHGSSDTGSFHPVLVFPQIPIIIHGQSEMIALAPNAIGRPLMGGTLSTFGFAGGYAPLMLDLDPILIGNAAQPDPLPGFDTLVLNGICDVGSNLFLGNPTFRNRVQNFVAQGGKLIIWDSECINTDYSQFVFPFTTNNPGATGAKGTLRVVEENTLSSADLASPFYIDTVKIDSQTDAVGDANVFLTFDPNWCVDMEAINRLIPEFKPVHTYVVFGQGLIIYNGLDRDYMRADAGALPGTGTFYLAKIWELELKQPWNPSGLRCDVSAVQAQIVLEPASALLDVGGTYVLTATVTTTSSQPIVGVLVKLEVTGTHTATLIATTNGNGVATFSYVGSRPGDDGLLAQAGAIRSNRATAHWNGAPVANAGPDQIMTLGVAVQLDGSGSTDPNPSDTLTFAWTQVGGPAVTLSHVNTATPVFTPTQTGVYVFDLTVSDGRLNDTDTVTITIVTTEVSDLQIAKDDHQNAVQSGQIVTYILALNNAGTQPATGVAVTDTLPANTTFVAASDGGSVSGGLVTWPTFSLAAGSNVTRTVTVRVDSPLPVGVIAITNTVTVADDGTHGPDPTPENNTAADVDRVIALADLAILKTAAPDPVTTGERLTYTIMIANHGPSPATGVILTDTLPAVVRLGVVTPSQGTCQGTTPITCDLATLASGAQATVTIVVTPTAAGMITNTVSVSGNELDPDENNNGAIARTTVILANRPPTAYDQTVATDEDTAVGITLTAADPDGDPLSFTIVSTPSHGILSSVAPDLTYTPNADYHGLDAFTFTASDGVSISNIATVSITVNPVNDPPIALDDEATTPVNEVVVIGVLRNDSDKDGDQLRVTNVSRPALGIATIRADNWIIYTPKLNLHGTDVFSYTISDGKGGVATATITIHIEITPTLAPDLVITRIDRSGAETDFKTLKIKGNLRVQLKNQGTADVMDRFLVTLFEDSNRDGLFTSGVDKLLGQRYYTDALTVGTSALLTVPVSGVVLFRDNLIWAFVDSTDLIAELDENNNYYNIGLDCWVSAGNNQSPAPDLTASYLRVDRSDWPRSLLLTARVGNGGAMSVSDGIPVTFYTKSPAEGGQPIGTVHTTRALAPSKFEDVSFTWQNPRPRGQRLYVAVDDDGTGYGSIQECDEINNDPFVTLFGE